MQNAAKIKYLQVYHTTGADPEGGLWGLETPPSKKLNKRSIIIIWGAK